MNTFIYIILALVAVCIVCTVIVMVKVFSRQEITSDVFSKDFDRLEGKISKENRSARQELSDIIDSFFKAFLIKHQDAYQTIAFVCPNTPDSVTIVGTTQSVNTVETFTGYDLFGFLDDAVEEEVEDEVDAAFWTR